MSKIRHSILTLQGKQELFKALNSKDKAVWNKAVVGSGDIDSVEDKELMTELVNQEWEGEIVDSKVIGNVLILKIILDSSVGGFEIKEVGIKNDKDELVVVASSDIGYKSKFGEEGGFDEIELDLRISIKDSALVEIVCDESNIYVTRKELDTYVKEEVANTVENSLPDLVDDSLSQMSEELDSVKQDILSNSDNIENLQQEVEQNKETIENIGQELSSKVEEKTGYDLISNSDLEQIKINKQNIASINSILNGLAEFLEEYV